MLRGKKGGKGAAGRRGGKRRGDLSEQEEKPTKQKNKVSLDWRKFSSFGLTGVESRQKREQERERRRKVVGGGGEGIGK